MRFPLQQGATPLHVTTATKAALQRRTRKILPNLRCCLLSGGGSRRMGRDKALLPHPEGGTWLSRTLLLLAQLGAPITLLSRWPQHLSLAGTLGLDGLEAWSEPQPHEGPLLALNHLMQRYPDQHLLLCPVDMPHLTLTELETLEDAAAWNPRISWVAHDGQHCQPLLGLYTNTAQQRSQLIRLITGGERRFQTWLEQQPRQMVQLDPASIRNVNHPVAMAP